MLRHSENSSNNDIITSSRLHSTRQTFSGNQERQYSKPTIELAIQSSSSTGQIKIEDYINQISPRRTVHYAAHQQQQQEETNGHETTFSELMHLDPNLIV